MQAMIFAAGMGTRLKPLTDVIPKALVPVNDKPLLQMVLDKVGECGAERVVVNVHHKAGQIRNFLSLASRSYPFSIAISDESDALLETGGGIRKARHLFSTDEPVLIHNVDILSNVDLGSFYEKIGDDDALLLVSERKTKRYLVFDNAMRLVGWTNIETGEIRSPFEAVRNGNLDGYRLYAFAGIHVIGQTLLADMEQWQERFPIIDFYLNRCMERNIRGCVQDNLRLLDVGKLDTLAQADEFSSL